MARGFDNVTVAEIAEAEGVAPDTPRVLLAAALITAGSRAIYVAAARRLMVGERTVDLVDGQRRW
ncbi:hypothetical protein GTS_00060 [Gandjariella thermophila]|uniref:Uncharacterized protein n=1 Tax=Gandjariella thermophila TaxID=1931992 RepID=A0A4D4J2Z4_9PSEU|nr:hypothetical protein GTS_00060 [Gandjariella thermophila]